MLRKIEREFVDRLYATLNLDDNGKQSKTMKVGAKRLMNAMHYRQGNEGFSAGYLSHSARDTQMADMFDRMLVRDLVNKGYDLEDMYQLMNGVFARHMGDQLEGLKLKKSIESVLVDFVPATPAAMWYRWNDRQPKTVWSGIKVELK